MTEKEVDLLLKQFKSHVNNLINCEEQIVDMRLQCKGIRIKRSNSNVDEAKPDGTKIYKNTIIYLRGNLYQKRQERNYHLFAVREVMKMLQALDDDEVELLELYYWDEVPIRAIGKRLNYSKSRVQQLIDGIIVKIGHVQ